MIFFDIDQTLINHQYAQDMAAALFFQQFLSLSPYSPAEFYKHWQTVHGETLYYFFSRRNHFF
jgi:FMN phosphatase YigB (HAD superfamily)